MGWWYCWIAIVVGFMTHSVLAQVVYTPVLTDAYVEARQVVQDGYRRWVKTENPASNKFTARNGHAIATLNGSIIVAGGHVDEYKTQTLFQATKQSDVWASEDGANWQQVVEEANWRPRYGHTLTNYKLDNVETLVLIGGFAPSPSNDVWTSLDGEMWNSTAVCVHHRLESRCTGGAPFPGRGWHASTVFLDRIYVLGGSPLTNDVWWTNDTVHWYEAKTPVPWTRRCCMAAEAQVNIVKDAYNQTFIQHKMFMFGGWDGASRNDVWYTLDGEAWTLATPAAPWTARGWMSTVTLRTGSVADTRSPRIWMAGGGNIGAGVRLMKPTWDVWTTRDGVIWVEVSSDSTGQSTAEWCMTDVRGEELCMGKWSSALVVHSRTVDAYELVWDRALRQEVPRLIGRRVEVPALYMVGGATTESLNSDVYHTDDGFLCEKGGTMCSGHGLCVLGPLCTRLDGELGVADDDDYLEFAGNTDLTFDCEDYVRACLCDPAYIGEWCHMTDPYFVAVASSLPAASGSALALLLTLAAVLLHPHYYY